jgi:pimeloyl-ACP methyl ester carboxylesterase
VTVHLRRMYVDCRFGQLHMHTAFPSSGGFDELTPLLCVHPAASSGRVFRRFLREMGGSRSVYAPDLPGCGESDAPGAAPTIADYASAFADMLDSLRVRKLDVVGYQAGSLVAAELALLRPEVVRRLVLIGLPVFDAREREAYNSRPWPVRARDDGSHLLEEWQRARRSRGPQATLSQLTDDLAASLRAGDEASWSMAAAANYAAGERLPLVKQPVFVLRPRDDCWDMTTRSETFLREARRVDLPDYNGSVLEVASVELARYAREFLD